MILEKRHIMGVNNYLAVLIFFSCFLAGFSTVFYSAELSSECSGTLIVSNGAEVHKFTKTVESLGAGIIAGRVRMEGCGCYILYQGPGRMGRAYFITRSGQHRISFSRIGSVYEEKCSQNGHKNAGVEIIVIVTVLGLLIVTAGVTIVVRQRRIVYKEVCLEPHNNPI